MPSPMRVLVRPLVFAAALPCLAVLPTAGQTVPRSSHVWILNEENHSYEDVIGNVDMPYYNQLAARYGLATQSYAEQHSSLPALMWYVAGAAVEPNNDTVSCQHTEDNIVRELLKKGYTWRSYQENMPSAGFQGLYGGIDNTYYRRHNPLIDFSDVCPGTHQDTNSVPFPQMAADLADGFTPNFAFITPDSVEDAHSGTLQAADQWLQANVPAILARPEFQPGGDGILFIVWDEGNLTDDRCSASLATGCGGRTPTLVLGPRVRPGYQSADYYRNQNVLKTVCVAMGLDTCPGAAQNAAPMSDFFTDASTSSNSSPTNSISITSPGNGATVTGAVHLIASASEDQKIIQTQVWDNGRKLGVYSNLIDATYNLAPGSHTTTVIDLNPAYQVIHRATVSYSVQPLVNGIQIISPAPGQLFDMTTVHLVAQANESVSISQIQLWDNGVKLGWYTGNTINQYFTLAPGSHTLTVIDLDYSYSILHKASTSYTVQ